jgi:regulator of protease activity HflC (stomatin/prohibitin superfamily)
MPIVISFLVVLVGLGALAYWSPSRVTVYEFERGLRYRRGRFVGTLPPGSHWVARRSGAITRVDVRPQIVNVPGQELLTADGIGVKVSLVSRMEVADPAKAVNSVQNYTANLYTLLQVALRQVVSSGSLDDLLAGRANVGPQVLAAVAEPAVEFGLKVLSVDIRDIMLPGDLKRIFAQELAARKEGLAALEKARGETAALRNLANAARLVEETPALLQLRILQHLGASSGNTVVLGETSILPIPSRKARPSKGPAADAEPPT